MWSDPDDIDNWAVSPRGAGWLFGAGVVKEAGSPFLPMSTIDLTSQAVQPRQQPKLDRSGASTSARGLQVHV